MQWHSVRIPNSTWDRIKRIYQVLGYASPSAFIAAALSERLPSQENRAEEIREAIKSAGGEANYKGQWEEKD